MNVGALHLMVSVMREPALRMDAAYSLHEILLRVVEGLEPRLDTGGAIVHVSWLCSTSGFQAPAMPLERSCRHGAGFSRWIGIAGKVGCSQ